MGELAGGLVTAGKWCKFQLPFSVLWHHPRGEGHLVTTWVGWQLGILVSTDTTGGSITPRQESPGSPQCSQIPPSWDLVGPLWVRGNVLIPLSHHEWDCLCCFRDIWPTRASIAYRFSILLDCLFLDFFDQRDQIFFGAFLFVLLGISGMTVSPALSPGYKRQKPNPGNSHVVPRIPWSLVSLPSSLHSQSHLMFVLSVVSRGFSCT